MSFAHHFWERKAFLEPMCVYLSKRIAMCSIRTLVWRITLDDCIRAEAKKRLLPRKLFTPSAECGELRRSARVAAVLAVWETPKLAYSNENSD